MIDSSINQSKEDSRVSVFNHYHVNMASRAPAHFGNQPYGHGSSAQLPDHEEEEEIEESIHEDCIDES